MCVLRAYEYRVKSGAFYCHRCGSKGSWFDFKARVGDGADRSAGAAVRVEPASSSLRAAIGSAADATDQK